MWLSNATSQVWPSGAALATTLAPIAPAAPGLFSTTICQPKVSSNLAWTRRATGSVEPPGGKGTMNLIGPLAGQSTCALTTVGAAKVAATLPMSSKRRRTIGILVSPGSPDESYNKGLAASMREVAGSSTVVAVPGLSSIGAPATVGGVLALRCVVPV